MATLQKSLQAVQRRENFRVFMRKLNPTANPKSTLQEGLVLENLHEPLLKGLVARADIEPSSQQLLMGCIGSGKTTLLLRAEKWLDVSGQVLPIYIDVSGETDLTKLCSGALLASFGIHLVHEFSSRPIGSQLDDPTRKAFEKAGEEIDAFAYGATKRVWVPDPTKSALAESFIKSGSMLGNVLANSSESGSFQNVSSRGKLSPPAMQRFPADVKDIQKPLESYVSAARGRGVDLIAIFDGLDRLPSADKFWAVVDQDFQAMRLLGVGVIATAPQSLLYGEGRAIAAHFDRTHQIRALSPDPQSKDLKDVLVHRGGTALMDEESADLICDASGGVLRDLIALARDAGEEAYVNGETRIHAAHVDVAIRQMGESYFRGLGPEQIAILRNLTMSGSFDVASSASIELLAMGRVLEYSATDFRAHPTILPLLSAGDRPAIESVDARSPD